jgi:hypothetical protein
LPRCAPAWVPTAASSASKCRRRWRRSRARIEAHGWTNVAVRVGDVAAIELAPHAFDAALFHYTHDVLQSPPALARVFAALRPGARVAVAGLKTTHPPLVPLNLWAWWRGRPYRTTDANLRRPWTNLLAWVPDFRWRSIYLGTGYIGGGTVSAATARPPDTGAASAPCC